MKKVLSVAAIKNGTVIDHIPAGEALRIVRLLRLADHKKKVTLGLNLPSQSMGFKDLIKLEDQEVSEHEAYQIAIFAPKATITIIHDYEPVKKFTVNMQNTVEKWIACPNRTCITNHERVSTFFDICRYGELVELTCKYCEQRFSHEVC